jgi:tetratricopeptide (TPR) repeat protein
MKKLILVVLLSFIALTQALGAENEQIWKDAADSYDKGQYRTAIDNYNTLMERGYNTPEVYYNLGNSYFKAGDLGRAIWSYRRALKLDSGFKQAKDNLNYVRTFNTDQISLKGRGFILDIWDFLSGLLSANGYLLLMTLGWWLTALGAIYAIIRVNGSRRLYYLLILPLFIVIFSAASAARRIDDERLTQWGVLIVESADIREGPGDEFNKVVVAHEGLEFRIIGVRENSCLIELENGLKGWVNKQAVLEI